LILIHRHTFKIEYPPPDSSREEEEEEGAPQAVRTRRRQGWEEEEGVSGPMAQDTINLSTYNKTTYMEMAGKKEGTDTTIP